MPTERTCPTCGARSEDAAFCAMCGTRLSSGDAPPTRVYGRMPSFEVSRAEVVTALVIFLLLAAVLVLASGRTLGVVVALLASVAAIVVGRRRPADVARGRRVVLDLRDRGRFAVGYLVAWSRAGRHLISLRRQLRRLAKTRRGRVYALGEAVVRGDGEETESLSAAVAELDQQRIHMHEEIARTVEHARRQQVEARLRSQPTELIEPHD